MITYSSAFHNYYQAYYLANSPLQLQLLKQNNRGFGFEDKIWTWSNTVSNNLTCENCDFQWELNARRNVLIDEPDLDSYPDSCDVNNYNYSIWEGEAIILPLFWDNNNWEGSIEWNYIENLQDLGDIDIETDVTVDSYIVWIVDTDLNTDTVDDVDNVSDLDQENINTYLVIANTTWDWWNQKFCIDSKDKSLPTSYININTIWRYHDTYVWLNLTKNIRLPEYLIYSVIDDQ